MREDGGAGGQGCRGAGVQGCGGAGVQGCGGAGVVRNRVSLRDLGEDAEIVAETRFLGCRWEREVS